MRKVLTGFAFVLALAAGAVAPAVADGGPPDFTYIVGYYASAEDCRAGAVAQYPNHGAYFYCQQVNDHAWALWMH
ncbi:hypothetical protein [Embleya sp. MST-111070]|uniref:hypothetical protein n=1 Tax=Embleya sp. MST-111070 TaxID=3398231 RepID=UPI003F731BB7